MARTLGAVAYKDEEIAEALELSGGMPVQAAKALGMNYSAFWKRLRSNPELYQIQKAFRAKTFQEGLNFSARMALLGLMRHPVTDKDGNLIYENGKIAYKDVAVPMGIRANMNNALLNMLKADDGLVEILKLQGEQSIDPVAWLQLPIMEREQPQESEPAM